MGYEPSGDKHKQLWDIAKEIFILLTEVRKKIISRKAPQNKQCLKSDLKMSGNVSSWHCEAEETQSPKRAHRWKVGAIRGYAVLENSA